MRTLATYEEKAQKNYKRITKKKYTKESVHGDNLRVKLEISSIFKFKNQNKRSRNDSCFIYQTS